MGIGDNTAMGQIANLTTGQEKRTPINEEIRKFILLISAIAITLGHPVRNRVRPDHLHQEHCLVIISPTFLRVCWPLSPCPSPSRQDEPRKVLVKPWRRGVFGSTLSSPLIRPEPGPRTG